MRDLRACASQLWPAESAAPGSCAACGRRSPDAEITVIGNTGDDFTPFGLHVCPDLDTVMYTLGGGISEEQGWGRAGETRTVLSELDGLRRRARLVRSRRPGHRHAHPAQPAAGPGPHAVRGHQDAVRAVAAGCHPAADVGRSRPHARHRRARRPRAGAAFPGVVGPPARGGPGPRDRGRRRRRGPPGARRARRDQRRRLRPAPALEPGRQRRARSWRSPASPTRSGRRR